MKILKKIIAASTALLITSSLFSCSWNDVTISPNGTPPTQPGGSNNNEEVKLTSNGTYGLVYDEGLDFYVVTGYHGTEADVFIPAEWNGKPVSGINSWAFNENSTIESITITSAIKSVGKNALFGNYKVFCEAELVEECEDETCTEKHLPSGWHANWYNNSAAEGNVEWGCGSFGSFSWETDSNDDIIITGYIENPTNLTIPEKIGKRTVVGIKSDAFKDCESLKTIKLPDSIEKIDSFAFRFCTSLEEIVLPKNLSTISSYTFDGCTSLTSVTLPSEAKEIEIASYAFANCTSLEKIELTKAVKKIGSYAFFKNTDLKIYFIDFDTVPETWDKNWNAQGGKVQDENSKTE